MTLSVLSVGSEAVPFIKTGGLADVVGALPGAVAPFGVAMTTLLPGFPSVLSAFGRVKTVHRYTDLFGSEARIVASGDKTQRVFALDAPLHFDREGGPYTDGQGQDWADNWRRFAALGRAAADLCSGAVKGQQFDILHAHDWQAAMGPAYLRFAPGPGPVARTVMTIHNIAFQGSFDARIFPQLGLPKRAWAMDGVEYHGGVSLLKAGLESADVITTVSPSYAVEIRTAEFGMGLEGLISSRGGRVKGIVNGIDQHLWNPATDPALTANYTARTLARRGTNKRAVEKLFGLEQGDGPLFIVVSRLTWQKGMDVLLEVLDHLVGLGGRLALLGTGDAAMESALQSAAARHPGKIGIKIGYDENLSHLMQGGGDAILVPSRFEPCGLTQLYGLAYGCIPVVSRTGGLADTVIDANVAALAAEVATGLQFSPVSYDGLANAITRTIALFDQKSVWQGLQKRAMSADFSWAASGKAYADLYGALVPDAA